jgi:hypothetical protein
MVLVTNTETNREMVLSLRTPDSELRISERRTLNT